VFFYFFCYTITMKIKPHTKAFTLIELLVVVAVIGLLSSIVYASVSTAREKAVVAKTSQEIKQLQNAFELSVNDSGRYPVQMSISAGSLTPSSSVVQNSIGKYINPIPKVSPIIGATSEEDREYVYISNGNRAIDENNVEYYCDGNDLSPYEIFYKKTVDVGSNQEKLTLNDGKLLNEDGRIVVRPYFGSAEPLFWPSSANIESNIMMSPGFTQECGYKSEVSCQEESDSETCYEAEDGGWCYNLLPPPLPYDDQVTISNYDEAEAGYYVCN